MDKQTEGIEKETQIYPQDLLCSCNLDISHSESSRGSKFTGFSSELSSLSDSFPSLGKISPFDMKDVAELRAEEHDPRGSNWTYYGGIEHQPQPPASVEPYLIDVKDSDVIPGKSKMFEESSSKCDTDELSRDSKTKPVFDSRATNYRHTSFSISPNRRSLTVGDNSQVPSVVITRGRIAEYIVQKRYYIIDELAKFREELSHEPLALCSLFLFLLYYLIYFILYCGFINKCVC